MSNVLAALEVRAGALRKGSAELLAAARRLADRSGGTVDALICSNAAVDTAALGAAGADRVLTAMHADFATYCPDGIVATVAALAASYRAVLVSASATGKDLAPRIAARIGVPCAMDVTSVDVHGDVIRLVRPVYAGRVLQTMDLTARAVIAVRPGAYAASPSGKAGAVDGVSVPPFVKRLDVAPVRTSDKGSLDVSEARVVISGGRGLGDPNHFVMLAALATAFGSDAAVGASRAVVDAGWIDHGAQVGQTGKTVAPDLYIAIGISGAIQHLAGMRTAKTIVAINRDKDAPIFKVADYGIVGDLFDVVPALTAAVTAARAQ